MVDNLPNMNVEITGGAVVPVYFTARDPAEQDNTPLDVAYIPECTSATTSS